MLSLPRKRRHSIPKPKSPKNAESPQVSASLEAMNQTVLETARKENLPLPERYFTHLIGCKQVFDKLYRKTGIRPTYIGRTRCIRWTDVVKMQEARIKKGLPNAIKNLTAKKS